MANANNGGAFPEFQIEGATPEEENQLIMVLCYLPKSHRKTVKQLIIISQAELESYIDRLRTLAGFIRGPSQAAVLIREKSKDELVYNAIHEIGHLVWYYFLTDDERQDFLDVIEWVRGDERAAITLYAETEFEEHFAEAYANYVLKGSRLRNKEPGVYRWLKSWVFHGEHYLFLEKKLKNTHTSLKTCKE